MTAARGAAIASAILMLVTGCTGSDGPADAPPGDDRPTIVQQLGDIPGLVLLIEPSDPGAPAHYRTAEIIDARGSEDSTSVNVSFRAGPGHCSMVTGYATDESTARVEVTVIIGEGDRCGRDSTTRTTVLSIDRPLGDRELVVSEYSRTSLPIEQLSDSRS